MNNEKLLLLKKKFLAWANKWAAEVDDKIEVIQFDLPDIVNILQVLGFQIRDKDVCDPQDITVLKNGKRGMRIILSCHYSGERYYLENPTKIVSSKCVSDEFSKMDSVLKARSDFIQPLSTEMVLFVSNIVNQFCNKMMNEVNIETDSPKKDLCTQKNSTISESSNYFLVSPEGKTTIKDFSQVTHCNQKNFSETDSPKKDLCTQKNSTISESSNYFLVSPEGKTTIKDFRGSPLEQLISCDTRKDRLNIKEESLDKFYTSVKKVHSDLTMAISRFEQLATPKFDKTAASISIPTISRQQSQRKSKFTKTSTPQDSQFSTRTKSSPDLFKNPSSVRTPSRKLLSVKKLDIPKSKSNDDLKKPKESIGIQRKSPVNPKLYAHVKSTIPKANSLKRNK